MAMPVRTRGHGRFSPVPDLPDGLVEQVKETVILPS